MKKLITTIKEYFEANDIDKVEKEIFIDKIDKLEDLDVLKNELQGREYTVECEEIWGVHYCTVAHDSCNFGIALCHESKDEYDLYSNTENILEYAPTIKIFQTISGVEYEVKVY